MNINVLELIILSLAAYRIVRLITTDYILNPIREWIWKWSKPDGIGLGQSNYAEWLLTAAATRFTESIHVQIWSRDHLLNLQNQQQGAVITHLKEHGQKQMPIASRGRILRHCSLPRFPQQLCQIV